MNERTSTEVYLVTSEMSLVTKYTSVLVGQSSPIPNAIIAMMICRHVGSLR